MRYLRSSPRRSVFVHWLAGVLTASATLSSCGSEAPTTSMQRELPEETGRHAQQQPVNAPYLGPVRPIGPNAPQALTAETSSENLLSNPNGNLILANVNVVPVFWTSSVNSTVKSTIGGFYSAIVSSGYIDWLSEYSTATQQMGRGTANAPARTRGAQRAWNGKLPRRLPRRTSP